MKRWVFLATVLALVGPATAGAEQSPAGVQTLGLAPASIRPMLATAERYWIGLGRSPLCVPGDTPDIWVGRFTGDQVEKAAGSWMPGCDVWVNEVVVWPARPRASLLCDAIVHEVGHTTGLGHSTDPNNIMFPTLSDGRAVPRACFAYDRRARARRQHSRSR